MNVSLVSGFVVESKEQIKLRQVPENNDKVTSFTLAVPRDKPSKNPEDSADFLTIVAWERAAEFASQELDKGMYVEVDGYIRASRRNINGIKKIQYTDGKEGKSLSIPVFEINTKWIKVVKGRKPREAQATQ